MGYFEVHFRQLIFALLDNLFLTLFYKIMVIEKNIFSSNAKHNFTRGKVISKHKNDKTWTN